VRWVEVLTAAGYDVDAPDLGCCGMAGIFGHEAENQALSKSLWTHGWDAAVAADHTVSATGFSCRSQAHRLADAHPAHPIHLL